MGQSIRPGSDLTDDQVETFKISVSAACRRMTRNQILDVADFLHDIIRKRGCCGAFEGSARGSVPTRTLVQ